MSKIIGARNFIIPANTPANTPLPLEFKHATSKEVSEVIALGFAEISNPNNKHYNFGFNVQDGIKTIEPVSKRFFETNAANPLSERFTSIEFSRPENLVSTVILVPTEASGDSDIVVQVVLKYK